MMYADLHCDTLTVCEDLIAGTAQVSLPRLQAAGCGLQCFAAFVRTDRTAQPFDAVMRWADALWRAVEAAEGVAYPVRKASDWDEARRRGLVGAMLTLEEGAVGAEAEHLRSLYSAGARMMSLTWNFDNALGHPNLHETRVSALGRDVLYEIDLRPLTARGREVVRQMNDLGMMVDVSHLGDGGFWDVIAVSRLPVVASHSNARAVCGVSRNLSDDMIRALADNGGVMGLNWCPDFLSPDGTDVGRYALMHVRHVWEVGGEDVLALGTDFDGTATKAPLFACEDVPVWYEALASVIPPRVVDKMMWRNFYRVMAAVCG